MAGHICDHRVSGWGCSSVNDVISASKFRECEVGGGVNSGHCAIRNSGCESQRRCDRTELRCSLMSPQTAMDLRRKCCILKERKKCYEARFQ